MGILDRSTLIPVLNRAHLPVRSADETHPRTNPVGIQLLSRSLHAQIFPQAQPTSPHTDDIATSRKHLHENHLLLQQPPAQPEINFQLPTLQGATIDEHFYNLGIQVRSPSLGLALTTVSSYFLFAYLDRRNLNRG